MSDRSKRKPKAALQIIFNHLQWEKKIPANGNVDNDQISPKSPSSPATSQATTPSEQCVPEAKVVVKDEETEKDVANITTRNSRSRQKKQRPKVIAPKTNESTAESTSCAESTIKTPKSHLLLFKLLHLLSKKQEAPLLKSQKSLFHKILSKQQHQK
uniref:Uncharacterized protein n=1 Tax=Meloidogyne enterolobii TaxID=390850 RepID=A0A6V7X323_MELEN|nr:unnamed protein product [Meloidogyne enterolobii]